MVDPLGEFAWPEGAEPAPPEAGAGGRARRGGGADDAPAIRAVRGRRRPVDDAEADAVVTASWGLPDDPPAGRRGRSRMSRAEAEAGAEPDPAGPLDRRGRSGAQRAEPAASAGWRSRMSRADDIGGESEPAERPVSGGWRRRSGAQRAGSGSQPAEPAGLNGEPRAAARGRGGSVRGRGRRGGERSERPAEPRDEAELAREICLRQLAVRPRTRAELAAALTRRGISAETTAEVLDRYDEVGIIDDAAFARAWVASRHHGRGLARRALANELRQRGVEAGVAGEALDELDDSTEAATARALVDRKLRTARGEPEQIFRRLIGMLARKGYPAGVAIRAVKDALAAQSAEAAEFADQVDTDALAEAQSNLEAEDHARPDD